MRQFLHSVPTDIARNPRESGRPSPRIQVLGRFDLSSITNFVCDVCCGSGRRDWDVASVAATTTSGIIVSVALGT